MPGTCAPCLARLGTVAGSRPSDGPRAERRIAGFRLGKRLGSGPLGSVFEAEHEADGRIVAIKTWGYAGGAAVDELWDEAWLSGRLEHPGIVRVRGHGRYEQHVWVAQELMHEGSLARRIETDRWSVGTGTDTKSWRGARVLRITRLFVGAAEALGTAHRQGVAHLGIKPSNLFLAREGRALVLSDFGAANGSCLQRLSWHDAAPAAAFYLSPEQVDGTAPGGPASDVHALAACLHDALTLAEPGDASRRPQAGVPAPVWGVLERCLDPDPSRRPASAVELHGELRSAAEKLPAGPKRGPLRGWIARPRGD